MRRSILPGAPVRQTEPFTDLDRHSFFAEDHFVLKQAFTVKLFAAYHRLPRRRSKFRSRTRSNPVRYQLTLRKRVASHHLLFHTMSHFSGKHGTSCRVRCDLAKDSAVLRGECRREGISGHSASRRVRLDGEAYRKSLWVLATSSMIYNSCLKYCTRQLHCF